MASSNDHTDIPSKNPKIQAVDEHQEEEFVPPTEIIRPFVLPTTEETSHEHFDDNDVLPIDPEVVVSTSNLPLLTPEEDAETTALASNSSFTYIRPGVGTSRENEVPEDCEQQEEDDDKEPEKETSGYNDVAPHSSSDNDVDDSNDSDNDDNDNQGVSNHPQDEEELRVIPVEDTHPKDHHQVSMEEDNQVEYHIPSSP
nr:hypothetical protein Iba_chr11aCG12010 [Ipomoea batatas]